MSDSIQHTLSAIVEEQKNASEDRRRGYAAQERIEREGRGRRHAISSINSVPVFTAWLRAPLRRLFLAASATGFGCFLAIAGEIFATALLAILPAFRLLLTPAAIVFVFAAPLFATVALIALFLVWHFFLPRCCRPSENQLGNSCVPRQRQ
jgi:hypothetical protein